MEAEFPGTSKAPGSLGELKSRKKDAKGGLGDLSSVVGARKDYREGGIWGLKRTEKGKWAVTTKAEEASNERTCSQRQSVKGVKGGGGNMGKTGTYETSCFQEDKMNRE